MSARPTARSPALGPVPLPALSYDRMDAPRINIPLHTVIKLKYNAWTRCVEERIYLGPETPKADLA